MKKNSLLCILIILLGIVYFISDKQLFYYGKNYFKIYESLPLGIKPEFRNDFEGGFALWSKDGFSIAGNGVSVGKIGDTVFQHDIIKKVLKYGFNTENLVVLVEDTAGSNYYVEHLKNNNSKFGSDIKVKATNEKLDFPVNKWINIENKSQIRLIQLCRNYSFCIIIILLLVLLYSLLKRMIFNRNRKAEVEH